MAYRYIGNKSRLAAWIADAFARLVEPGATVADLMCGTAAVARASADLGFNLIAADQLRFPVLHAKARLLFQSDPGFAAIQHTYESALAYLNALPGERGFFWREYGAAGEPRNGRPPRLYFTAENAGRIDAIRRQIVAWRRAGLPEDARDILLHDLILAVNRVANIAGTYGYFRATWSRDSLAPLILVPSPRQQPGDHQVLHGPIEAVGPRVVADLTYIDPPYTKRQYAGNYHIPETIAIEDEPEPVGDGGLRDWSSQASDFCYRRRAGDAIDRTMESVASRFVVWSYSADGQVQPEEMQRRLRHHGTVTTLTRDLPRYRSNAAGEGGAVAEFLYIVRR